MPAPAPDPWARYLPKQPAPPRDWSKAPWGDVAWEGAKQLIPSYASDLWNSGVGLVKHLTMPTTSTFRNQAPSANEPVTMGLIRAASDAMLGTHSQTRPTVADFGAGVGHYAGSRYGSVPALKRTLATDPGGALMDAQALATIPEGGEGLVARVPGLGGDVLRGGATAARTFNKFTNPVGLAARGATATTGALRTAIKGGPVLDKTGAFTPAVTAAVQQAFPKGEITAAELANPKFRAQLTSTLQTKGINPAAVKEAVLAYHGAPTPLSTVTRTPVPKNVAQPVADAAAAAHGAIGAKVAGMVKGAPDPTVLGASVEQAHNGSLAAAGQNYENLRQVPGSFGPKLDGPSLNASISTHLDAAGMPSTPALLERSKAAYPQTNAALDLVNDALVNGNTRLGGEITTPEIMEVRRQLTPILNDADGTDAKGVGAVIDGLHENLANASQAGQFQGPTGPVDISGQLRDANAAYQRHFNTFDNTQGPGAVIARTVKSLKGSAKANLTGEDAQLAAGRGLATNLANPTQGPATYSLLKSALTPEGQAALDDYVRQSAVLNPDGSLAKSSKIRASLDGPAGNVFTPQEQSDLRLAAAGQDVLDAKPPVGSAPARDTGAMARRFVGAGAGAAAATLAAPLLPHFPFADAIAGATGAGAGALAEGVVEPYFLGKTITKQMAGAPEPGAFLKTPQALAKFSADTAPALPVVHGLQQSQPHDAAAAPAAEPTLAPEVDLSTAPGPYDEAPAPIPEPKGSPKGDPWARYNATPAPAPAPAAPADQDLSTEPGPYDNETQGYAAGGKVGDDVERLVTRLQSLAKHAKSATKKATEPLLKVPDAAITKALDVAQKAI